MPPTGSLSSLPSSPTSNHDPTPIPVDLLCPPSQSTMISQLNGLPSHLSLPTQPIPQHCLTSEALTLPHPPPRLAEMVCNMPNFSNMMSVDGNSVHRQPSPSSSPASPLGPAASPEAIASSAIAELTELTELNPSPEWPVGAWEPEQQDILSSAMAALSDMLDSSDCSNDLEYNYHFPSNLPITSSSFNFSNSPSLGNFNTGSSPSYNYPSQTDAGCYGMKTEAGMYGLKREVCYNGVKTETEQQHRYGVQSNSTTTKENFAGLSVKESYGLSPTSVLDYGSPPSSPPLADGWPMGEFLAWHMIFCCVTLSSNLIAYVGNSKGKDYSV